MTNSLTYPLSFPVLKVVQPLGEFFVAVIPANLLLQVTYSDPLRLIGFFDDGDYQLQGHQRKLTEERLKAIGRYVDTVEAAFPNSIILAANYNEAGELVEEPAERWTVELSEGNGCAGKLIIPSGNRLAAIIDGQHRLHGFERSSIEDRKQMPLLCSIYLDMPNPFQAYLFATINYNQKPVSKSQSYELYGYNLDDEPPTSWSPEKTAVFLCRKLNTDESSAFHGHILVAAQDDTLIQSAIQGKGKEWAVSTATVVEGLLRLFSQNPKKDRSEMHSKEIDRGRNRSMLKGERDTTPLRQYYIDARDAVIYTLANNYFRAVEKLLWKQGSGPYIRKTIGIQALFDVLRPISKEAVEAQDISEDFFENRLRSCEKILFGDNFFQISGIGRQRIRNSIEICLGLKSLDEMSEEYREDYKRVCQL